MRPNFFHHLHPPTIPEPQARFRYTLAAGGLAVFLMLVLGITGLLEMFFYIPTTDQAASSIQTLTFLVPFGALVRNLHYWSAQLLVIITVIHLLRVLLTGAYGRPRRFNYLLGLALLVMVVLLDFTGYVLRWDEGIHWALVTGTNLVRTIPWIGDAIYTILVGGSQPGPATLIRFYGWHTYGLVIMAAVLLIWHIFRVRRDGGLALPPPALRRDPTRITRFELIRREVLAMLLAAAGLILLSTYVPAPLGAPLSANSTISGSAHAPWFFLWVQEMLKFGNPFLLGVLVPLILLVLLALIPYILPAPDPSELGRWFPKGNRIAQILVIVIFLLILMLTMFSLLPVVQ